MSRQTYGGMTREVCGGGSDTLACQPVGVLWNAMEDMSERIDELEQFCHDVLDGTIGLRAQDHETVAAWKQRAGELLGANE